MSKKPDDKDTASSLMNEKNKGIVSEFWDFARTHKKLWLVPIFLILIVFGGLIILGGSSAAPFIYRLF